MATVVPNFVSFATSIAELTHGKNRTITQLIWCPGNRSTCTSEKVTQTFTEQNYDWKDKCRYMFLEAWHLMFWLADNVCSDAVYSHQLTVRFVIVLVNFESLHDWLEFIVGLRRWMQSTYTDIWNSFHSHYLAKASSGLPELAKASLSLPELVIASELAKASPGLPRLPEASLSLPGLVTASLVYLS